MNEKMEKTEQKTCPQCNNDEAYIYTDTGDDIEWECARCHEIFIENFTPRYYGE